jgi:cardiolipin synthase
MQSPETVALAAGGGTAHDRGMDRWSQPFTIAGNRLTMLPEGPERMEALLGLIGAAKRSLRVLYYIYVAAECASI